MDDDARIVVIVVVAAAKDVGQTDVWEWESNAEEAGVGVIGEGVDVVDVRRGCCCCPALLATALAPGLAAGEVESKTEDEDDAQEVEKMLQKGKMMFTARKDL